MITDWVHILCRWVRENKAEYGEDDRDYREAKNGD